MKKSSKKNNFREEHRQKLRERQNRERKTSSNYKQWIEFPEGVNVYKPKEGDHVVNLLEFRMGSKDPCIDKYDKNSDFKEGDLTHMLEVQVHRNVGPNKDSYVCPRQYNKPCPICEHRDSLWDEDPDYAKKLYPSVRCVYNILSMYPDEEQEKGVMLWDVAAAYMEDKIQPLAKKPMRKVIEGIDPNPIIADPSMEYGREISFTISKKKITVDGKIITVPEYSGHSLDIRDYDIPDEILETVYNEPDQYIVISSYDEIYEAFFGEQKSKSKNKEAVEDDIDDSKFEDSKKKVILKKKRKPEPEEEPEDESDNEPEDESDNEPDDEPEDEPDDEPEDEPDDESDNEPDDEVKDCPFDHVFGIDCGKYSDDCDDCDSFDECFIEKRALKKSGKNEEKEEKKIKKGKKVDEPEKKKPIILKRRK